MFHKAVCYSQSWSATLYTNDTIAVHSPPKSQEEEDLLMTDANFPSNPPFADTDTVTAKRHPTTGISRSDANGINDKGVSESGHGEPGSAWSTKKFAEEYERAFSQLQDQQWSMG
jgi:hypothetical protein